MKLLAFSLIAIIGFTSFATARTPTFIKLRIGQTKAVDGGKMTVKFLTVVEDSRCPMNARCVWAGNAKIRIAVTVGRRRAKLAEINSTLQPQIVTIGGYKVSLQDLVPQQGEPADWPRRPTTAIISIEKTFR